MTIRTLLLSLATSPLFLFAAAACAGQPQPSTLPIEVLPLADTVTRHGITWKFSEKVRVSQFVNGDYYVVGPVTVTEITPKPEEGRNQSALNLPVNTAGASPFDDRVPGGRGDQGRKLRASPPISMKPGDALISSISVDPGTIPDFLRPADKNVSPVGSVSVLTCLEAPLPADAFRPGYCDREQKIYLARNLRREVLPRLLREGIKLESETGPISLEQFVKHYERPWLDVCFFSFDAPAQYQPQYGRELGRAAGIGTLLLMLDFTPEEKEPLLLRVVQRGIDLWGIARAGYTGWPAHGGHGTGRKWPIIFAGILLGDPEMSSPNKKLPALRFGEDMQTMYGECWTGAKVVYAGHVGKDGVKNEKGWGAYEHLPPAQWEAELGEAYRRTCTSFAWVGEALAARILHAEKLWDHDAFFDYIERWMSEDDTQAIQEIKKARNVDYSKDWQRQRTAWDPFVNDMWAKYRNQLPPAPKDDAAGK